MLTVRLDPQLEEKAKRAASAEGISVSEFVRRALEKECRSVRGERLDVLLADLVGSASSGGSNAARKTGRAFKELLARRKE